MQSAADPPKKILLGERAVMADGNDYNLVLLKDDGKPVQAVYATEGSPLIIVPSGIFRNAPNPNAARLFQSFFFSAERSNCWSTLLPIARSMRWSRRRPATCRCRKSSC